MAGRFLQEKRYRLLDANYRCRWGEVGIVAQDWDELVFVEVRTRRGARYGTPEESVTAVKAHRLIATGQDYLQQCGQEESEWRIDLIAIGLDGDHRVQDISHLPNAVDE